MASRSPLRVMVHHQLDYYRHHKMDSPLLQNIPTTSTTTSSTETVDQSWEFQQEWKKMKEEYEGLKQNVEDAIKKSASFGFDLSGELVVFSDTERQNHPAIVKIICENKEGLPDGIPHLVYISREKRPKHPHYYKAGAMNALTRVSGLMTNAPFMLNVDCDMFANDPLVVHQAMCLLLGSKEKDCAFVQFPQLYHNSAADSLVLLHEYVGKGIVGIQGPFFQGTGCFHRRKVIYGLWPDDIENECARYFNSVNGKVDDDDEILVKEFGNSKEFIRSAGHALKGKTHIPMNLSNYLDAAHQVAGSAYEYGSSWGENFQEPGIYIPVAIFVMYNLYTLSEYIQTGFSVRSWWVNQSMARIVAMSAWISGFLNAVLKLLGLSDTTFEITEKDLDHDQSTSSDDNNIDENAGKFTFDESPVFVAGTTVLLVQLAALATGLLGLQQPPAGGQGSGLGEVFCSVFVVLCFWPFVEGLFRKGKYGIPLSIICKSAALTSLFVYLSKKSYTV
ncbi:hypothetical protein Dsin_031683 [Dipteronia sinensis]|uniref:Cellulose synthase-like protein H1 n=1 Tax=Dipteronia sinensis TaxID=43782 RepID=A0AAE0DSM6_9ROSI|nr:hypothetical protein Dsin_031683 [Dipteronia sinensis]